MADRQQTPEQQNQAQSGGQVADWSGDGNGLGLELQQEIQQAIGPILADFRAQVEQSVSEQVQKEVRTTGNGQSDQGESQAAPGTNTAEVVKRSAGQLQETQTPPSPTNDAASQEQPSDEGSGPGGIASGLARSGAVRLLEHAGDQALQALIVAGLNAILSERTRTAAQQKGQEGLHLLLGKAFDQLPVNETTRELREQTERTLSAILRDAIDAIYIDEVRADLERSVKGATHDLVHGNVREAGEEARNALDAFVHALVPVIRHEWQRLLRLLLRMTLSALENMVNSPDEASGGATSSG